MLPFIVIDLFLNNQPDALIIPILFCYKTLHVSGIFSAHHQEFSTLHSALASFMQVFDDRFQAESGWNILTLLGNCKLDKIKITITLKLNKMQCRKVYAILLDSLFQTDPNDSTVILWVSASLTTHTTQEDANTEICIEKQRSPATWCLNIYRLFTSINQRKLHESHSSPALTI